MGFTVEGFNRAKGRMLSAFNKAIREGDALRKDAAKESSDGCATAPANALVKSTDTGASADASLVAVDCPGIQADKAK